MNETKIAISEAPCGEWQTGRVGNIAPERIIIKEIECGGQQLSLGHSLTLGRFFGIMNERAAVKANSRNSDGARHLYELRVLLRRGLVASSGDASRVPRDEQLTKFTERLSGYTSGFYAYTIRLFSRKEKAQMMDCCVIPQGADSFALFSYEYEGAGFRPDLTYSGLGKLIGEGISRRMPDAVNEEENVFANLSIKNSIELPLSDNFMFVPNFELPQIRLADIPALKNEIANYLGVKALTETWNGSVMHSLAIKIQEKMDGEFSSRRYFFFRGNLSGVPGWVKKLSRVETFAVYMMAGFERKCISFDSIIEYCKKPLKLIVSETSREKNTTLWCGGIMNIYEEDLPPSGERGD